MSAREEHHSGELMGVMKNGKSVIILTIHEERGDQLTKNLLGLGSLVLDEQATLCMSILTAGCRKAESKEKYFHVTLDACLASFRVRF
jgi:hypothetical protein